MTNLLPKYDDPFGPGTVNCGGCGMGVCMKLALEELGQDTILAMPACCAAVSTGPFPGSSVHIPVLLHAFETTGASLAGIRAALDIQKRTSTTVVGIAGDGGTFDIGLQALSGAAERNENVIYICYDNEAYMNTGVQRSSATPTGVWTTTTPAGKPSEHPKKDIVAIMAAHQIPYLATMSFAFVDDFRAKMRRARATKGFRFLLMQSPCPTGWRSDSKDTVRISRLGVEAGIFPLLEVAGGRQWEINHEPSFTGLDDYLGLQGRFSTMTTEQRGALQGNIDSEWREIRGRVAASA
jgi:pyruvate/2-oxoacid:ferredoxin oxidoreductase beta subunit